MLLGIGSIEQRARQIAQQDSKKDIVYLIGYFVLLLHAGLDFALIMSPKVLPDIFLYQLSQASVWINLSLPLLFFFL